MFVTAVTVSNIKSYDLTGPPYFNVLLFMLQDEQKSLCNFLTP